MRFALNQSVSLSMVTLFVAVRLMPKWLQVSVMLPLREAAGVLASIHKDVAKNKSVCFATRLIIACAGKVFSGLALNS